MIKIIDYYADWCGPCKMLNPVIEQIKIAYPEIVVEKVDIDAYEGIAEEKGISSIPALIFEVDGVEKHRTLGFLPKQKIEEIIKALID
jgi:thioredoxin 1